jgi:rubrerythrin
MVGAIGKWDILSHPVVTIQCFGWTVFFRAVFSWPEKTTFLSLLAEAGAFSRPRVAVPEFVERCIDLERRAERLYQSLSQRFARMEPAREFFEHLAQQERSHAELLELCGAAAGRGRWREALSDPWRHVVPLVDQQLKEAEASLGQPGDLADALRLVIQVEASQINGVFAGIVEATDSRLLRKLDAFRSAVHDHLGYIFERIPILEPALAEACQALRGSP